MTRRLFSAIFSIWFAVTLTFLLLRIAPGNAIHTALISSGAGQAIIDEREAALGLNAPIIEAYVRAWWELVSGNSVSLASGIPIHMLIEGQLAATAELAAVALALAIPTGLVTGLVAARGSRLGRFSAQTLISILLATPVYWSGLLILIAAPALFPALIQQQSVLLPAAAIALGLTGTLARATETSIRAQYREAYILAARSRGVPELSILTRHALRAGAVPITSTITLQLAFLISGVVVTETVFARAGLGRTLVNAVLVQDFPVVQAIVALTSVLTIAILFLSDGVCARLDPRIRME